MPAGLSARGGARRMTEPPSPPSPPSGPPLGTYFSRRKLHMPRPPSPPFTNNTTRSTNMGSVFSPLLFAETVQHDSEECSILPADVAQIPQFFSSEQSMRNVSFLGGRGLVVL